jgi:general secretion pathway protein H
MIEILIVLVIVAMAAALVAPAIDAGMRARELRSAVRSLAATFRTLQGEAIRTGKAQELLVDPVGNQLRVANSETSFDLGDVARIARLQDVNVDPFGVAHVRFFPNGSTTGVAVLINDPERPQDMGFVVRLDPLIGGVTVRNPKR